MKKSLILLMILLMKSSLYAQKEVSEELAKLELSNAPSVMLLGLSSSDLETPKSKKVFMTSIVNSFSKNEGLPNAYAVEITPTHMLPLVEMDPLKYAGIKNGKNNIFSEAKNISFSLAFLKNYEIENLDSENPSMSFSLRTTLLRVRNNANVDSLVVSNTKITRELNLIKAEFLQSDKFLKIFQSTDPEYIKEEKLAIAEEEFVKNYYKEKTEEYKKHLDEKPVFQLDFASAYSTLFLDNQFKNNQFGKLGVWFTLNYGINLNGDKNEKEKKDDKKSNVKIENSSASKIEKRLNFYGIARYLQDGTVFDVATGFSKTNNYDFGGKIELVYNKFSIGYEFIYRSAEIDDTYRSNGILNYKVSDNVYINAAFGKNYGDKDNLISFLGLNWGLDNKRKAVFVEENK